MKKILSITVAGLMAVACASGNPPPSVAGEPPNLLIVGEDFDTDTVARHSRVFNRVLNALSEELISEGFTVYDETAISLDEFEQNRIRRTDAEIIDLARSVTRPPIDVGVIFQVYGDHLPTEYTNRGRLRVTGRLLNVRNGRRLGNFTVTGKDINVPWDCYRDCALERLGHEAAGLAADVGVVLATRLDALSGGTGTVQRYDAAYDDPAPAQDTTIRDAGVSGAYSLLFSGFTPAEMNEVEEYLVAFSGYENHRIISSALRRHEYWYETGATATRLNRNLRKMLDYLGFEGRVAFNRDVFTIDRIRERKLRQ